MEASTIQKYKNSSVPKLMLRAVYYFNAFIRNRDAPNGHGICISSGKRLLVPHKNSQAGHFYSGGKYPALRFNEDNVHLQGKSDNYFVGGNLLEYRKNLINKIGQERVDRLDMIAAQSKRAIYKWDRFFLIEVIEKYKKLNKDAN